MLWGIKNKLTRNTEDIEEEDIDMFLYMTQLRPAHEPIYQSIVKSLGTWKQFADSFENALKICICLIDISFAPLRMFKSRNNTKNNSQETVAFDSQWISSIVNCVHACTGYTEDYILNKISFTKCAHYFIQYAKSNGSNICENIPEEIIKAQDERACELILDRLKQLGIIEEEEAPKLKKEMLKPVSK